MPENRRIPRINELLRSEISDLIRTELKDPRVVGLVSVTEVDTTTDLRHARVFVSVFGSEEEQRSTLTALRSAAGFLRHETAQRVTFRHMPELEFLLDSSIERGDRLLRLIREAQEQDAALAKQSVRRRRPSKKSESG